MKKILSIALCVLMLVSVLTACGAKKPADDNKGDNTPAATLKFGMGVSANYGAATDATADKNGAGEFNTTAVAVLLDAEGKIVKIDVDTAQIKTAWTTEGKVIATTELRTKYEKGMEYNMAAFGKKHDGSEGKPLEWFEQAAEFNKAIAGKTASEFAALAGADSYATGDLAVAGCTMAVGDMIAAAVKAATVA